MAFETTKGEAYWVLYTVLTLFTLLAFATTPFSISKLGFLPESFLNFCCLAPKLSEGKSVTGADEGAKGDYFLSARNSASAVSVGLSFFASGMGAWVLYGSSEIGATASVSWFGVIGYAFASAFPAIIIAFLGPRIRDMAGEQKAFSTSDFARVRYGRLMQLVVSGVSIFYMFIYVVAEFTSISNVYRSLTNDWANTDETFGMSVAISLGVFTVFYTTVAGLPASIATDKFQALVIGVLMIMLLIAVTSFEENRVTPEQFAVVSNWTGDGVMVFVSLVIAIASAELFNQGTWQRVWAAESVPAMRKGFFLGSFLVFLLIFFFGVFGMIALAKQPDSYDFTNAYLAFFNILEPLSNFWHIMVLVLTTALAASSVDSLQNALTSVFSRDLVKVGWNPLLVTRILVIGINVYAVFLAVDGYSVLALFLVADLVCATSVLPLFLGMQTKDIGFLTAPTELGSVMGCLAGVITVVVNGHVNKANGGGIFEYFWLKNDVVCALCGSKMMITFIVTPSQAQYLNIWQVCWTGERARSPLFKVGFNSDDTIGGGSLGVVEEAKRS